MFLTMHSINDGL